MQVCGVICEYNPFHNGHAHHLRALRAATGCDFIVCVMSGHFTQRGHAALLSKWARAEMALRSGADAVFELPTLFAVRDAERFARGGVGLLSSLGVVTHLGFGSESGDLSALYRSARQVVALDAVRQGLQKGQTLARARGEASASPSDTPNDTLAIEYLRSLDALGSGIEPVAIPRAGHGYHDPTLGVLASATAIRASIQQGTDVSIAMPATAYALFSRLLKANLYQRGDGLDTPLLALLRTAPPEMLASIADVSEGLEHRIARAAQEATSRKTLLSLLKCKRYTHARLSRILTQALLGMTKPLCNAHPLPTYARLLGFRQDARPLLAAIRTQAAVPIITRAAKYRLTGDPAFALDLRAGDLWTLGLKDAEARKGCVDAVHKVIMIP